MRGEGRSITKRQAQRHVNEAVIEFQNLLNEQETSPQIPNKESVRETLIKAPPRSGGARKYCKTNSAGGMLSRRFE